MVTGFIVVRFNTYDGDASLSLSAEAVSFEVDGEAFTLLLLGALVAWLLFEPVLVVVPLGVATLAVAG